jgi:hypothetical protein
MNIKKKKKKCLVSSLLINNLKYSICLFVFMLYICILKRERKELEKKIKNGTLLKIN